MLGVNGTRLLAVAGLCLAALTPPAGAALVADRTVLKSGDPLRVVSTRSVDRTVDVHIGFMKGQGTPLFDRNSAGVPLPSFANVSLSNPLVLTSFSIPAGLEPGLYVFYEVVTTPGGDPNDLQDWAFGLSSLSQLALYVNVSSDLSGDRNGDGRPDDDSNRDGFRDSDSDLDGLTDSPDASGATSAAGGSPISVSWETTFRNAGVFPAASAKARYRARADGVVDFKVEAEDLPLGSYQVLVNGSAVATLRVVRTATGNQGEVEFRNPVEPGKLPLNFSPVGATLAIAVNFDPLLSTDFLVPSGSAGGSTGGSSVPSTPIQVSPDAAEVEVPLVNSGSQPQASGKARYRSKGGGVVDFRVEVEDLSVGAYSLWVGGVNRGTIQVTSVPGGTEGEIEFRNPVEPGKVLLNFSPRGEPIEVKNASGVTMLSIQFPD